jgi:hypothetical protein
VGCTACPSTTAPSPWHAPASAQHAPSFSGQAKGVEQCARPLCDTLIRTYPVVQVALVHCPSGSQQRWSFRAQPSSGVAMHFSAAVRWKPTPQVSQLHSACWWQHSALFSSQDSVLQNCAPLGAKFPLQVSLQRPRTMQQSGSLGTHPPTVLQCVFWERPYGSEQVLSRHCPSPTQQSGSFSGHTAGIRALQTAVLDRVYPAP